jgi:transposase
MARPRRSDPQIVRRAHRVVHETRDVSVLRQALSIVLPAEFGSTLEQTARVLGVGRATVARLQHRFRNASRGRLVPAARAAWGGRRRALMTDEQERQFLAPWIELAKKGQVLVLSPIRAALAQHLGRPVAVTVVYRLLARHGWRKVAPDTRHPKSDLAVQEAWKKNFRRIWQPY